MAPPKRRTQLGPVPETLGWRSLMEWLKTNPLSRLAKLANVSQPSAHAWRWRDSRPSGEALRVVCDLTGATQDDWKTIPAAKRKGAA